MRTGAGIAIPLPGRLAENLGLSPGTNVRVEGPDDEGAIRIIPLPPEERIPAPETPPAARSEPEDAACPPTAEEVARALSRSGPVPAPKSAAEPAGITQELDRLMERHGETLREVEP